MATVKSYTDLEQSRKLAEILPIESADMAWCNNSIKGVNYTDPFSANLHTVEEMRKTFDEALYGWDKYWELIPCWSLAAILELMPSYLFEYERGIDLNIYRNLNGKGWHVSYMPNNIIDMKKDKFRLITNGDSPIDAAFEMVLKLHELKVL